MNWQIRFAKEDIAKAGAKGKHLCAVGYHGHGRAEAFMFMDPERTTAVWLFAHNLNRGMTPADAFADVEKTLADAAAKRDAEAAT